MMHIPLIVSHNISRYHYIFQPGIYVLQGLIPILLGLADLFGKKGGKVTESPILHVVKLTL